MNGGPTSATVVATTCLWLAVLTIWTAALMPQFFPVWLGRPDALDVIAQHPTLWRVNATLFLVSAFATLAGCVLVFSSAGHGPFARPALALLTAATPLWAIDLVARMSVVPIVALDRSPQAESWLALVRSFTSAAWCAAAALIVIAFAGLGADVLTARILPAWIGWACLGSAALSTAVFIATRDAAPVIVYLPVLPLAVAVSVEAAASRG